MLTCLFTHLSNPDKARYAAQDSIDAEYRANVQMKGSNEYLKQIMRHIYINMSETISMKIRYLPTNVDSNTVQ